MEATPLEGVPDVEGRKKLREILEGERRYLLEPVEKEAKSILLPTLRFVARSVKKDGDTSVFPMADGSELRWYPRGTWSDPWLSKRGSQG